MMYHIDCVIVMYFVCQMLAGTRVCTESISKDISADHHTVLEWKESMIAYCHFCLVYVCMYLL